MLLWTGCSRVSTTCCAALTRPPPPITRLPDGHAAATVFSGVESNAVSALVTWALGTEDANACDCPTSCIPTTTAANPATAVQRSVLLLFMSSPFGASWARAKNACAHNRPF